MIVPALKVIYDGWASHERSLIDRLNALRAKEVLLRTAPGMWTVWQLAAHVAGSRAYWLHSVLGEGDAAVRDMFRVQTTTVPGLPIDDAGWEDDEDRPRTPAELVDGLSKTWAMLEDCLARWTTEDLAAEFERRRPSGTTVVSRQWVVWHLLEHDLHHAGEMSQILGSHGVGGLDL